MPLSKFIERKLARYLSGLIREQEQRAAARSNRRMLNQSRALDIVPIRHRPERMAPRSAEDQVHRLLVGEVIPKNGRGEFVALTAEQRAEWDKFESLAYGGITGQAGYDSACHAAFTALDTRIRWLAEEGWDLSSICQQVKLEGNALYRWPSMRPSPAYVQSVIERHQAQRAKGAQ